MATSTVGSGVLGTTTLVVSRLVGEFGIARRRNVVGRAKLFGEGLRAFEPGRRRAGPERLDTGCGQVVDKPRDERRFRPDDDEVDTALLAERLDSRIVADVQRHKFSVLGDTRIAGCCVKLCQKRTVGKLPGECMLAAAGAEEENFHAR